MSIQQMLLGGSPSGYLIDKSLRFRASASAYLSRSAYPVASAGTQWTLSMWVKRGSLGIVNLFSFVATSGAAQQAGMMFDSNNNIRWWQYAPSTYQFHKITTAVFRDPSAWYHLVFVYDTTLATAEDRCQVWVNGVRQTAFSTNINPSLNLVTYFKTGQLYPYLGAENRDNSSVQSPFDGYLAEVNFIDGQALTPASFGDTNAITGVWQPAPYTGTYGTNGFYLDFEDTSSVAALGYSYSPNQNYLRYSEEWGNAVWGKSRIASVTANAVTAPNATLTADKVIESTATGAHHIYQGLTISSNTEVTVSTWVKAAERTSVQVALYCRNATYVTCVVNLLDGTFTSSNSNYIYNVVPSGDGWYRISISGSNLSGTNVTRLHVFLVNASGSSSYTGDGSSGLYVWGGQINLGLAATDYVLTTSTYANTSFAVNNVSLTAGVTYDSMTDVPTLTNATAANYAVLNPLDAPSGANIASGNLNATNLSTVWLTRVSTVHTSSGKYYAEVLGFTAAPFMFGIVGSNWRANIADSRFWLDPTGKAYYSADGNKYTNGSGSAYGATYTFGDVIGIALDLDAGTLEFYKNGVSQGVAFSGLSGGFQFAVACYANNSSLAINFGQRPFAYTPPTNFVALNTFNLPTATILKGNTVMDVNLWSGTSASNAIVNAAGFKPDLVWIKSRSNAISNGLFDSVRGTNKALYSNLTAAEDTYANTLNSFNTNGFTLGNDSWGGVNTSGRTYVGWQWQAGQGSSSSNTDGSITSTVSVNPTAGFSVITYTGNSVSGATVGHGLGVAPTFWVIKRRDFSGSWKALSTVTGSVLMGELNTQTTWASPGAPMTTAPTSSVITLDASGDRNGSGQTYVIYAFTPIAGFSYIGYFNGNGSTNGPFVYTGFRPKFTLSKDIEGGSYWAMMDSSRSPFNVASALLNADLSGAESTSAIYDYLSNGIKLRSGTNNQNNHKHIMISFAENPFKNSLAR